MAHKQDWWEGLREWVIPKIGVLTQLLEDITGNNYYVKSSSDETEYVGTVPMGEEALEQELDKMGFQRNPLSALKSTSRTGNEEEGSFRKIGFEHSPDMQLHLILYGQKEKGEGESDEMYLYAHWEKRWDRHPIEHYRGVGKDDERGVTLTRGLLEEHGVEYSIER
jgi:hypothetical protein